MTADLTPALVQLLAEADATPPSKHYLCASDYAAVVHVLRTEKGFTWREITEWFAQRGVQFSQQSWISGYRNRYKHGETEGNA